MRVLLDGCGVRTVRGTGSVASEANGRCGFEKVGRICAAVRIVTTGASYAVRIHAALNKIIALHTILVCGAVGVMCKGRFAEFVFFHLPKVAEILCDLEADWPIEVLPCNRIC